MARNTEDTSSSYHGANIILFWLKASLNSLMICYDVEEIEDLNRRKNYLKVEEEKFGRSDEKIWKRRNHNEGTKRSKEIDKTDRCENYENIF